MIREGGAIVGVTACSGFQSLTADGEPRNCLGRTRAEKLLVLTYILRTYILPENQLTVPIPQPSGAQDCTKDQHRLVAEEENGGRHSGGVGVGWGGEA